MIFTDEQILAMTQKAAEFRMWRVPVSRPDHGDGFSVAGPCTKEHAVELVAALAKREGWTVKGEPQEFAEGAK